MVPCCIAVPASAPSTPPAIAVLPQDAVPQYVRSQDSLPLSYEVVEVAALPGLSRRTYSMKSQVWPPNALAQPAQWQHDVTVYIPDGTTGTTALVVANNGSRWSDGGKAPVPPTDFTPGGLEALARKTGMVVASISDVPNQPLVYTGSSKPLREDDNVAHTWNLYMEDPQARPTVPLHVPMAASIARGMTLVQREVAAARIKNFIVTGTSKRALSAWLATIADRRIAGGVFFAADMLNTREVLRHMYKSYGNAWPGAFQPYYAAGIDTKLDTPEFARLMQIEDPLQYLGTRYEDRLAVPKYIVNAGGDDFFRLENPQFYFDKLPGSKSLMIVPNASHYGIRASTLEALEHFIVRTQRGQALPEVRGTLQNGAADTAIALEFSEPPQKLQLFSATNADASDFREACGIRFVETSLEPDVKRVAVSTPDRGWSAYFVQATFADGFVATSQAWVLGKREYPSQPPATRGKTCATLQGRG
jgi:PhoPQ-activated pathogenicity-related protein